MATYLFLGTDLANFSSNLPIVILENWNGGKPNADTDGFWGIIEPDALGDNRSHISADLAIATRCNMKVRGSSSAGFAKYSLALEAQDEEKFDQGISPLGMPKESDWVLSGRYSFDRALMRNPLIYRLSNESGEYAVRTRFVEVFLNTGGGNLSYASDYFGVYTLMEKIKRDKNRTDVAKIAPSDTTEPGVTGGYMWKQDRADPGDSQVIRANTFTAGSNYTSGPLASAGSNRKARTFNLSRRPGWRTTSTNSMLPSTPPTGSTPPTASTSPNTSTISHGCATTGSTRWR